MIVFSINKGYILRHLPSRLIRIFYQIIKVVLPGSIRRQTLLGLEPFGDLLLEKLRHYVRKFKSNLLQT